MRKNTKASLRYAKALFDFSKEQSNEKRVNEDMLLVSKTFDESSELSFFLTDHTQKNNAKLKVVKAVFEEKISNISQKLIELLIANKRIGLLKEIADSFCLIFDKANGIEVATVTTAVPINDTIGSLALIKAKEISGNNNIIINNIVDPSIIGGFILRVGDIQYNDGISNKLSLLKRTFDNSIFESKF
jgi:F-type H+-transporting ATPase subunit delta